MVAHPASDSEQDIDRLANDAEKVLATLRTVKPDTTIDTAVFVVTATQCRKFGKDHRSEMGVQLYALILAEVLRRENARKASQANDSRPSSVMERLFESLIPTTINPQQGELRFS
jgi:hypothetical protein